MPFKSSSFPAGWPAKSMWNQRFDRLGEFPFRRLAAALADVAPDPAMEAIDLSIGEPRHAPPALLAETVAAHSDSWNRYPPPQGTPAFREAAADWLARRFELPAASLDPGRHILPVAGTKEAIFLIATAATPPEETAPAVLMPSPLYAVYLGAATLARAEPVLLPATRESGFMPDLDSLSPELLERTTAFYLCSPGNPQGAIADLDYLARAVELARRHEFLLITDECYSEIYDDAAPPSGLKAAHALNGGFDHVVALHSLSKRSNAAGLRSGFVAGDAAFLACFLRMRAYGAAVQPLPLMAAATALWRDEAHVEANRARYRAKFDLAERRLGNRFGFYRPPGGFFLWLDVEDGVEAARRLWREAALKVLPGLYLTPGEVGPDNPGHPYVRLALVDDEALVDRALSRFVEVLG